MKFHVPKPSEFSHTLRTIFLCAAFFLCAGGAWADSDYFRWYGGGDNSTWEEISNWEYKTTSWTNSGISNYPDSSSRHVYLNTTCETGHYQGNITVTLTSDITIADLYIEISDTYPNVTINLNGHTLTVTGTLSIGNKDGTTSAVNFTITGEGTLSTGTVSLTSTAESTISLNGGATLATNSINNNSSSQYGTLEVTSSDKTGKLNVSSSTGTGISVDKSKVSMNGAALVTLSNTFKWTGSASSDWNDSENWLQLASDTSYYTAERYPGSADGDTAFFPTQSAELNVYNFTTDSSDYTLNIKNESVDQTKRIILASAADDYVAPKMIYIDGYVLFYGVEKVNSVVVNENAFVQIGGLTIEGDFTVSENAGVWTSGKLAVNGTTENNGAFNCANAVVTFAGDYSGSGSFVASSADTSFYGSSDFSSCTAFNANGGTIYFSLTSSKTLTAFSAQAFNLVHFGGVATLTSQASDGTIKCAEVVLDSDAEFVFDSGRTLEVSGGFSSESGGKITNNGTITSASLSLGSASSASAFVVDGSGTFIVSSGTATLTNLSVGSDIKIEETSGTLVNGAFEVTDGTPSAGDEQSDYIAVYKNGWDLGFEFVYTWTGASSTDHHAWSDNGNWDLALAPGMSANNTVGVKVVIPDGCAKYPVIYSNFSISSLTIGTASLSSHDAYLTINNTDGLLLQKSDSSAGTLTNYGTIEYRNSGRLNDGTNPLNDAENGGTVEYSGTAAQTVTDFSSSGADYANLLITGTNVETGGEITVSGNLSVAQKSASQNGSLQVKQNLVLAGDLSVDSDCSFKVDSGKSFTFGGTAQKIEISSSAAKAEFANLEIASTSSITTASDFTVTGDWTNEGSFSSAAGTITFSGDTNLSGENTFYAVIFSKASGTVTISDSNTFSSFESTAIGSTIKFGADKTQSVTASFKITGSSVSKISLTSDSASPSLSDETTWWILNAPLSAIDVTHAQISYSNSRTDITSKIDVEENENSEPAAAKFTTTNWFERKYYWLGSASSSWADAGNWFYDATTSYPAGVPSDGSGGETGPKIIIATTGTDLVLEKDISVKSLTINADKTLDFAAFSVTVSDSDSTTSDFVVGNGATLRFKASGSALSSSESKISGPTSFGSDVVFEYYGGGKVNAVSGDTSTSVPESQILKITNADDGTPTHLLLGSQSIKAVSSVAADFNAGIIEIDGAGELSFADSSLSMTSGLILYSAGSGNIPSVGFYNLQVDGGSRTVASDITCENIYLTGGTFSVESGATLTVSKNFAAFGSAHDEKDLDWHNSDNTRFAYPDYEDEKDNFVMPSSPSAAFGTLAGTISVGNNFYVNGADMSAGAGFSLVLPPKTAVPVLNTTDAASPSMWGLPYAVAFNMTAAGCSVSCADGTSSVFVTAASSSADFKHQNVTCSDGDATNWATDSVEIESAESVSDSVIHVVLNTELEKLAQNGSLSNAAHFSYNEGGNVFSAIYLTYDEATGECSDPIDFNTFSDDTHAVKEFYLKSSGSETWNTDASGASAGSDDSTNLSGAHKSAKLDLSIIEGFFYLKEGRTLSAEYSFDSANDKSFTETTDGVAPVLIAVYTGQEAHVTPSGTASSSDFSADSQKPYDAHNFIEFRYSEPVSIGDLLADETSDSNLCNIEAQSSVSAATHGGAITNESGGGITVAGFGTFSSGEIHAGVKSGSAPNFTGTTDTAKPHALYRKFSLTSGGTEKIYPCRIRIAIAGKVDGTVSMSGASFYNWIGYIDSAACPSGTFAIAENQNIKDSNGNVLDHTVNASLTVNASAAAAELYGGWDTSAPVFAPYVTNTDGSDPDLCWSKGDSSSRQYEIAGSVESNTSAYIERIEMHLFDNKPDYNDSDPYKWVTQHGWMSGSSVAYKTPESEGGSRPFNKSPKTKGGIRRSSLSGAYANFSYTYKLDLQTSESREFAAKDISQSVKSALFRQEGASETSTENDGLYLALSLNPADANLPLRTTFVVTFTKENSFITDLAGNRLVQTDDGVTKRLGGLDITPPSFSMVISPIGQNKVFAIFTKPLDLSVSRALIKENIEFVEAGDVDTTAVLSDLNVTDVSVAINSHAYTALLFTLNRKITISDVEKVWIRVNEEGESSTNEYGVTVITSYIRDAFGNGVPAHTCHAISDFAVNAVDVIYAYSHELDGDNWNEQGIYGSNAYDNYAVHDFSADGGNYSRLLAGRDITFQIRFADYDNETQSFVAPDYSLSFLYDKKSSLKSSWISDRFNLLTSLGWRLWIDKPMSSLASGYNDGNTEVPLDFSDDDEDSCLHAIDFPHSEYDFAQNEEYQFFFKILDSNGDEITIDHDGDSETDEIPLYAFWTPSENISRGDFSFVDLWSFTVSGITKQRGGVTILNNVINAGNGEKTAIEVDMKSEGNLNIFVMTLDGNIIKRLQKGSVSAGTHFYYWDGKNNAGKSVARGLYFVRVSGSGIDETRKVMVVK